MEWQIFTYSCHTLQDLEKHGITFLCTATVVRMGTACSIGSCCSLFCFSFLAKSSVTELKNTGSSFMEPTPERKIRWKNSAKQLHFLFLQCTVQQLGKVNSASALSTRCQILKQIVLQDKSFLHVFSVSWRVFAVLVFQLFLQLLWRLRPNWKGTEMSRIWQALFELLALLRSLSILDTVTVLAPSNAVVSTSRWQVSTVVVVGLFSSKLTRNTIWPCFLHCFPSASNCEERMAFVRSLWQHCTF